MFKWLLNKIFKVKIEQAKQIYDAGLLKGYELGYMMGKTEAKNRGFIIGSNLEKEIEDIFEKKGWG